MIFDQVCKIVEQNKDLFELDVEKMLRDCKIFQIENKDRDLLPIKAIPQFFLPYQTMCFSEDGEDGISILTLLTGDFTNGFEFAAFFKQDINLVGFEGKMEHINTIKGYRFGYYPLKVFLWNNGWIHDANHPAVINNQLAELESKRITSLLWLCDEINNTPAHCIIQKESQKNKPLKPWQTHIPRTNNRPLFTILKPAQMQAIFSTGQPNPNSIGHHKHPHSRRSHYRRLFGECYKNKKVIKIAEMWIGDKSKVVGKHVYKVVLDADLDNTQHAADTK